MLGQGQQGVPKYLLNEFTLERQVQISKPLFEVINDRKVSFDMCIYGEGTPPKKNFKLGLNIWEGIYLKAGHGILALIFIFFVQMT